MNDVDLRIINCTVKVFNLKKAQATTDDVCRMANIAKGTLFNHFKSKDILLEQTYLYCNTALIVDLKEDMFDNLDFYESLSKIIYLTSAKAIEIPDYVHFVEQYHNYKGQSLMSTKYYKENYKGVLSYPKIYNFIKENYNKNLPLEFILMVTSNTIYQTHNYLIDNPEKIKDTVFMNSIINYIYHLMF